METMQYRQVPAVDTDVSEAFVELMALLFFVLRLHMSSQILCDYIPFVAHTVAMCLLAIPTAMMAGINSKRSSNLAMRSVIPHALKRQD